MKIKKLLDDIKVAFRKTEDGLFYGGFICPSCKTPWVINAHEVEYEQHNKYYEHVRTTVGTINMPLQEFYNMGLGFLARYTSTKVISCRCTICDLVFPEKEIKEYKAYLRKIREICANISMWSFISIIIGICLWVMIVKMF